MNIYTLQTVFPYTFIRDILKYVSTCFQNTIYRTIIKCKIVSKLVSLTDLAYISNIYGKEND